jgi:hypothetical protein
MRSPNQKTIEDIKTLEKSKEEHLRLSMEYAQKSENAIDFSEKLYWEKMQNHHIKRFADADWGISFLEKYVLRNK